MQLSWASHLRARRRHLPYEIAQCYLPPNTSELAPHNPIQPGWYLPTPEGLKAELIDLGG